MATRDVLDNRIDVWKDQYKDNQRGWREAHGNRNFGQVLRGDLRPSDQVDDGPLLGAQLKDDGWVDVYEAPNGFGWIATFEAEEAGTYYRRSVSSHMDQTLVETDWEIYDPEAGAPE